MQVSLKTCQTGANLIAQNIGTFIEDAEAGRDPEALADLINAAANDCETLAKQLRSTARDVRVAGRAKPARKDG